MKTTLIRFLLPLAVAASAAISHSAPTSRTPPPSSKHASNVRTPSDGLSPLLPPAEAVQVRQLVVAQIQAMAEDDADRMFQTITPAVREAVGSSGRFLAMMHGAYPMVSQASVVTFHPPRHKSNGAFQLVEITDSNQKSWLAVFILEKQADQTWGISGCAVAENTWLQT